MQKTGKMQTDNCIQLPKYVIIVAGGKGLRMGGEIPKQFRPISGHPVLMHTLEAFYRYDPEIEIILGVTRRTPKLLERLMSSISIYP